MENLDPSTSFSDVNNEPNSKDSSSKTSTDQGAARASVDEIGFTGQQKATQHPNVIAKIRRRFARFFSVPAKSENLEKRAFEAESRTTNGSSYNLAISGGSIVKTNKKKSNFVTTGIPSDISDLKRDYEESLIVLTSLTDGEILAVRDSWKFLKTYIEKIGVIVFLGLFEEHEDFRDAFSRFRGKHLMELSRDPALQSHGLRVLNVVDKLVSRLHRIDTIDNLILSLGSKHAKYVPHLQLLPSVGNQLIEVIRPVLTDENMWNEKTETGWVAVTKFMTAAMIYGLARTPKCP